MSEVVMFAPAGESDHPQLAGSWRQSLKFLTGLFGCVTSIGFLNLTLVINDFRPPVRLTLPFASLFLTRDVVLMRCLAQLISFFAECRYFAAIALARGACRSCDPFSRFRLFSLGRLSPESRAHGPAVPRRRGRPDFQTL